MSTRIPLAIRVDVPCPFCGGRAELRKQLRDGHEPDAIEAHAYVCDSCACVGGWGKSETSALRLWNMRTAEESAAK